MRTRAERRLLAAVIGVSLGLTGLTVWAVALQGRALQQREWADLTSAAATAAAQRAAALTGEVQRACDAAGRAWQAGQADELDAWAADQRSWWLTAVATGDGPWMIFPRPPLEHALPSPSQLRGEQAESQPATSRPAAWPDDPTSMLDYFKRRALSPDPLTRAGALLAAATYEEQLGHPLAAARILTDAASLLRSTPGLARFAFRAELGRIDSLLAAGDRDRAEEALRAFLKSSLSDHPARVGPTEVAHLRGQLGTLGLADHGPLADMLGTLDERAQRREALADAARALLHTLLPISHRTLGEPVFLTGFTATKEPLVVAVRPIAEDTRLALVAPAAELLAQFWRPTEPPADWRVVLPPPPAGSAPLVQLGPEFAHGVLTPAPAAAARSQAAANRRLGTLALTAAGSAGAWLLIIWMLTRVMAGQRELAHLRSRFVADVSHELKTPLALIRLLAETLAEQRVRDPQRLLSYHQTIARESERLTGLLENILDLGRIESGRKRYEFGPCDVSAVVRQAWALFEPQFAEQHFDARLDLAADLPVIRADPAALQQVLVNLLQNAHRYAGSEKYVRLAAAREGYLIVLTVEDHGIGMSRDQLDCLGDSFFRAEDTRVRQTRGAGLGLAIASHIVAAHRGRIEVQSRPGQGSTFTVWLPFDPVSD